MGAGKFVLMAEQTVINLPNCKKGNTFPGHNFYATKEDLTVYDLTDCEIKAAFRFGSATGIIQDTLELADGFTMIDPLLGHFFMDSFTVDWPAGKYFYDIQVTKADNTIDTPVTGTWTIGPDITPTT